MQDLNLMESLKEFFQYHFKEVKNTDDLLRHRFFRRCLKMILVDVEKLNLDNPRKEEVSKSFLEVFYTTLYQRLKNKISDLNIDDLSRKDLEKHFINNIENAYNQTYEKADVENIPDIFIDKFKKEHRVSQEIVKNSLCRIVNSAIIESDSNYVLVDRILDTYLSIINFVTFDLENVLEELNGELDEALDEMYK